uniref:Uncharacterized protein n=1 Tax=Rhipicephalus microplus TaxID=6941 RepID=A0A6G5AHP1_RHIMP
MIMCLFINRFCFVSRMGKKYIKTSHQMADLVCIIDMLGYLVLLLYIFSHPRDETESVYEKTHDHLCTVHCSSKDTLQSSHEHSLSLLTTFAQVGAHVSCKHKQKCGCELKTMMSGICGKF